VSKCYKCRGDGHQHKVPGFRGTLCESCASKAIHDYMVTHEEYQNQSDGTPMVSAHDVWTVMQVLGSMGAEQGGVR